MANIKQKNNKNMGQRAFRVLVALFVLANILIPSASLAASPLQFAYLPVFSQILHVPNILLANASEEKVKNTSLPVSGEREPNKKITAVITAYTSTVDQCDDDPFIAASGKHVYDGMIAANFLPMGTHIKIPSLYGDKIFTVDDRMNSRYGYGRMDMWMDAPRSEAIKFGVKKVEIEIYYEGNKIR
ncbi:3D domain-containing protein [Patescibacteria group bacterium]|nr:3D domain-containing protein [Patescibacteria group bacterium]MBU1612811.1 3D domain-containing protein [Patescibacteria group bacterium]